jgi:hypothetical protein
MAEPIAKVINRAVTDAIGGLARYKFSKPRLPVRIRTQTGPLLNLYKRKMQNQCVRLNFLRNAF